MLHFLLSYFTLFSSPSFWPIFQRAITLLCLFLFLCSLSSSPSKSCRLLRFFLSPLCSSFPLTGFKILFTGEESRKSVICIFCQACMVMEHFTVRRGNCLTLQHRGSGVAIDCTRERGSGAALYCTREGEQLTYAAPERGSSCLTLHQREGAFFCWTREGELKMLHQKWGAHLSCTTEAVLGKVTSLVNG
jgi:hypothetical protein